MSQKAIWLSFYSRENNMGLLSAAYFDASGRQERHFYVTVAGATSLIKKWIRFEGEWSQVLKDEGVSEFHATDFAASEGEYKVWKGDTPRRTAFLRCLMGIIKENVNKLFMVTVEMPAWNEVNKEYLLAETVHSPYALAGFTVAAQARKWAMKKRLTPSSFEVFFEDGDDGWGGLRELCQTYCNFEPIRIPKKKGVPFQIGDLLAWKTRITATNAVAALESLHYLHRRRSLPLCAHAMRSPCVFRERLSIKRGTCRRR